MNMEETRYNLKSPHRKEGRIFNVRTAKKFFENMKSASSFESLIRQIKNLSCSIGQLFKASTTAG
jgi:hypothetical protein